MPLPEPLGFIIGNKTRFAIVAALRDKAKTPTEVSHAINRSIFRASTVLKELADKNFVQCVNPKAKRGRLYSLTDKGRVTLKKITELIGGKSDGH